MERPVGSIETRAAALVDHLRGTCNQMPEWVREDPDENAILGLLDDELFECAECGWWSELSEDPDGGDDICSDCAE